jgi:hypothetical protein
MNELLCWCFSSKWSTHDVSRRAVFFTVKVATRRNSFPRRAALTRDR